MKSIQFTYGFDNQLIINAVDTLHFKDLYIGFFNEMIEEQKTKSFILSEFNESYCDWALEEVLKVGLVTIYHFWEKCLRQFLKEQASFQKITISVKWKKQSFVEYSKEVLEKDFLCILDDSWWKPIEEARKIVNTYKHGELDDFLKLKNEFPYYFEKYNQNDNLDLIDYFYLGKNHFDRLTSGIAVFWEKIPYKPTI